MNKTVLLMGCIAIVLSFSVPSTAQILSPIAHVQGELDSDTMGIFIGRTSVDGTFHGYDGSALIDSYLPSYSIDAYVELLLDISLDDLRLFLLLGSCMFDDIDSVQIIDLQDLENIITFSLDDILTYSDVSLIAEGGPFVFGTDQGTIEIQSEVDYAISSFITLQMEGIGTLPFLTLIATSGMDLNYASETTVFMPMSANTTLSLQATNGTTVWTGGSSTTLLLLHDNDVSFTQDSPIYLLPISETDDEVTLAITPSENADINVTALLDQVTTLVGDFGSISSFTETLEGFDDLIDIILSIVNGGMVLIKTDDTIMIDQSPQTFSRFGFGRAEAYVVNIPAESDTITFEGNFKLVFLGDHFYTAAAKDTDNGVAFPIIVIVLWIIAIALYFLFRFYIKTDSNEDLDKKIKRYALIFHIAMIIVAFILLDREISFQFGSSVLDVLFGQGLSPFVLLFLAIQMIMWTLGVLAFAIPVRMITNSGLRMVGIQKGGKGIAKGVGALFIWVFCALYVKVIVNLVFSLIDSSSLLPTG